MPRQSHSLFDHLNNISYEYRSFSFSICTFLLFPLTSSFLSPNILLRTLFLNTFSLCFSLNVSDQVSHPYKTGKIIVMYILIFMFLVSQLEDVRFCTQWQQAFPDFILLVISCWMEFWFVRVVPKYLNCSTFSRDCDFSPAFWYQGMTTYLVF